MQISEIVYKEWVLETVHSNAYDIRTKLFDNNSMEINLFNPSLNVMIGTWYLKRIWNHYLPHYKLKQSIENLLISYHDGPKNCQRYRQGKRKLGPAMRSYLKKYKRLSNG